MSQNLQKAYIGRLDDKKTAFVPCLFNPKELSLDTSNKYAEVNIPGLQSPIFQYVRGNSRTLNLDLFFDTYENHQNYSVKMTNKDVRQYTDKLTGWNVGYENGKKGLMDIDSDLHAPPVCIFVWGKFAFQCIIEKVNKKFTMFTSDGIPVRATLNVSLKEYTSAERQIKKADKKSSDLSKLKIVRESDSILSLCGQEYGDPKLWRVIAEANGLDNVRDLKPGSELILPPLE